MSRRLPAHDIDHLLKSYVEGAKLNDPYQARQAHKYLVWMLTENEVPAGKWWLTDYGKTLLIDMHHNLSQSPEQGDELIPRVLEATMLKPVTGDKRNLGDVKRDIAIAQSVLKELEAQRKKGKRNITQACDVVAKKISLSMGTVRNIYYKWMTYFKGDWEEFLPSDLRKQLKEEKRTQK